MDSVEIIGYSDDLKKYFKRLNYEWIEKFFAIEPNDEYVLSNPIKAIIEEGGSIFFAKLNDEIVGTVALIKIDDSTAELAKMAVTEHYQNYGIGKQLMYAVMQQARKDDIARLVLYSHTSLAAAIHLYTRFGFRSTRLDIHQTKRANIKMELLLKNWTENHKDESVMHDAK